MHARISSFHNCAVSSVLAGSASHIAVAAILVYSLRHDPNPKFLARQPELILR